ncbi:amidohydrolase family-domain-containing protein [Lentinula edodes]|uniref:amidohydrolase family-domain-containing protein n=1 Tax=Lentinula edodes TaxID=5353 RepID=UPI001E8D1298|nr:amidohydrolase family-domain-containing protein [Lentinula edodes]KAH7872124.1 amidohydrolase family-domain-containing protein [Lentinula edodes]
MNCVALYLIFYGPIFDDFLSNVSNLRDLRGLYNLIDIFDLPFTYSNSHSETQSSRIYTVCSSTNSRPVIYTVDAENSVKECIVVRGTDVIDSGILDRAISRGLVSTRSEFSDAVHYIPEEAIVVPSFTDSHVHSLEYGFHRLLPLDDADSIPAVVSLVKSFILSNPSVHADKAKWVYGWGYDKTRWLQETNFPSPNSTNTETWPTYHAFESDPVTAGRPIWLTSKDGHAIWTSKRVIELAEERWGFKDGKWPEDEELEGGRIMRGEDGRPNGIFLDNAQALIHVPTPFEDNLARFEITVADALANGVTAMHDAGFLAETLEFYEKLVEEGRVLPIRMYAMHNFNASAPYWGNSTKKYDNEKSRLKMRSVKLICDGAMRSGGAYLYEPYTDEPSSTGFMRLPASLLNEIIPRFIKDGWQVNAHAIGDRANGVVLDAFEKAERELRDEQDLDLKHTRPRIEHAQIMTSQDLARIGRVGVIASIQPTHVTDDMWYGEARLGPERVKGLYAFRSMMNSGARITLGTDIPVEGINPLETFYAAITRTDKSGNSPHGPNGWFPEQKLTRVEALRGMTIDPAYASFSESTLGSLEPGKKADFVVLSKDIMSVRDPREVLETKVLTTVLDGRVVFGKFVKGV